MRDCARCHANASLVREEQHIRRCELCHTKNVKSEPLPGNHTTDLPGR
jgi:hypothetical protein